MKRKRIDHLVILLSIVHHLLRFLNDRGGLTLCNVHPLIRKSSFEYMMAQHIWDFESITLFPLSTLRLIRKVICPFYYVFQVVKTCPFLQRLCIMNQSAKRSSLPVPSLVGLSQFQPSPIDEDSVSLPSLMGLSQLQFLEITKNPSRTFYVHISDECYLPSSLTHLRFECRVLVGFPFVMNPRLSLLTNLRTLDIVDEPWGDGISFPSALTSLRVRGLSMECTLPPNLIQLHAMYLDPQVFDVEKALTQLHLPQSLTELEIGFWFRKAKRQWQAFQLPQHLTHLKSLQIEGLEWIKKK